MSAYIKAALDGYAHGRELSFVIVKKAQDNIAGQAGTHARTEELVGTTRFYEIEPNDRRVAIGYTWLSASAQRTAVNTEAKLLLLTHACETWNCHRVELITDVLNEQSRTAILRLGPKQEGILRSHMVMPNGRVRDSVIFSIIRAEWPDVKERLRRRLCEGKS
jgi:RimJ/RimL family protein N-acetyltransferase